MWFARILRMFKSSAYRTQVGFFMLVGISTGLSSRTVSDPFWRELLLEFSIVFNAVGLIQLLWDFIGGDPVNMSLKSLNHEMQKSRDVLSQEMHESRDSLSQSLTLMADLLDGNLGVTRMWQTRNAWERDPKSGLSKWHDWVCEAKRVDIVGSTLQSNWLGETNFLSRLCVSIANGARVRLLVYDIESDIIRLRAADEGDPGDLLIFPMQNEVVTSLRALERHAESLRPRDRMRLEVRISGQFMHLAQIVRADDRMLVATYLSGESGGSSPTMQLHGPMTTFFVTYAKQFETLWSRSKPLELAELSQYIDHFHSVRREPAETSTVESAGHHELP